MNIWNRHKVLAIPASLLLALLVYSTVQATGIFFAEPTQQESSARVSQSATSNRLILTDDQDKYSLGLHLEMLEDPTGELTIEDVSSPAFEAKFTPSQEEVPNYGYTESAYWTRFTIDNQTLKTSEWLLEDSFPNTQYVDLYTPLTGGAGFEVRQTGVLRPLSTRDVLYPNIVFRLNIAPQSEQTYYLRFQSGASMTIALTLWTNNAFFTESSQNLILHWLLFGGLLALLVYHLFMLFFLREITYLLFVFLLATILGVLMEYLGYMSVYLIPNLYQYKTLYFPVMLSLMYIAIMLCSASFMALKIRLPALHRINGIILMGWVVILLLTPFTSYLNLARLMIPWQFISLAVICVIGIAAWKQGARPARFFMLAWLGMAVSLGLLHLVRLSVLPSTAFTENLFQLGFMVMAVSWSIALADRINLMKIETDNANRALLKSEYRLSQILEGFPLGVVVYGQDQKPQYLNKRASEILSKPDKGITASVEAGRTLAEAINYYSFKDAQTGEIYPLNKLPVYKALHGEPASDDNLVLDFGDQRIPLEVWASPVRDDTGIVETAIGVFQDITARKHTETELEEYRKSLEQLVEKRTMELNQANDRLRVRLEWVSAINHVQQSITGPTSLGLVYDELSGWILELTHAIMAFIVRWDDSNEQVEILSVAPQGWDVPERSIIEVTFRKDSPLRRDFKTGKTILWSSDKSTLHAAMLVNWFRTHGVHQSILAPMIVGQSSFGVLCVGMSEAGNNSSSTLVEMVEMIAFDLAKLAEDAMLSEQKLALVALNERNRLARDLHDSVTQVLFTATLLTEIMPQIWRRDPEQGMETLEKLRQLTRGALAEMRTMLIELRPSSVVNTPLSQLVAQLTEAITCRSGLPFQLVIENVPLLPEDVQMTFYRIAQEALNNVVKHAQALRVVVTLSEVQLPAVGNGESGRSVKLVIQDDGVGFYPKAENTNHLGLGIMRERAAAIDASLSIVTEPGHGTIVSLIWWSERITENTK